MPDVEQFFKDHNITYGVSKVENRVHYEIDFPDTETYLLFNMKFE